MAKFRFRLEPLLKARRHVERDRQRAVAELERRRQLLEAALRRQQGVIDASKGTLGDRLVGPLDVGALRGQAASTIQAMRQAHRLVLELAGIHKRLDAARIELTGAMRERRVVERLRERRFEEWRRDLGRAERAELDEISQQIAARKEA